MKFFNYYFFILLTFCYSQTSEQIMQAKSYAKKNNMTEKDILNAAVKKSQTMAAQKMSAAMPKIPGMNF